MSQNELTIIAITRMQSFFLIFNCTCMALNIFDSNTRCPNTRNNGIVDFCKSTIQCCQIWQFAVVWATFQTIWQQIFCLGNFAIWLHFKLSKDVIFIFTFRGFSCRSFEILKLLCCRQAWAYLPFGPKYFKNTYLYLWNMLYFINTYFCILWKRIVRWSVSPKELKKIFTIFIDIYAKIRSYLVVEHLEFSNKQWGSE